MSRGKTNEIDYVVVGSGVAGLRAAIELGHAGSVLVMAKSALTESATEYAQGGIAAALSDDDEISLHEQDTIAAGDGLCDAQAVKVLVEEGPTYIHELIEWGTQFDRAGTKLAFTREGAHSRSRILHAHGDSTGREIARALFARARSIPKIHFEAGAFTTRLLVDDGRVCGLEYLDEKNHLHAIHARAVLLATGGLGQVYRETTNPTVATGDGMAVAYEAGAVLSDLEFVQFHPTALAIKGAPRFLLSEALRGEGGVLRNVDLERFMKRYNEAGELAPRDIVARAIVAEMQRTKAEHVYLDMTAKNATHVRERFPRIYTTCLQYGVDIGSDLIPVRPAAHYSMGGVKTDLLGRTNLAGLYAAGETAATGVHGANRLASNSLLEGLVFGARAGKTMLLENQATSKKPTRAASANTGSSTSSGNTPGDTAELLERARSLIWRDVGIIRAAGGLKHALDELAAMKLQGPASGASRAEQELHNVWTLGQLVARCALAREESRGSHYRSDFPYRDDERFSKHSEISNTASPQFH
ncbi:MAG: L-aspartate oxidase [Acidobacteria bacterium]|nr:L-aspartate oxidase [Acidobacteriota bacterium]